MITLSGSTVLGVCLHQCCVAFVLHNEIGLLCFVAFVFVGNTQPRKRVMQQQSWKLSTVEDQKVVAVD